MFNLPKVTLKQNPVRRKRASTTAIITLTTTKLRTDFISNYLKTQVRILLFWLLLNYVRYICVCARTHAHTHGISVSPSVNVRSPCWYGLDGVSKPEDCNQLYCQSWHGIYNWMPFLIQLPLFICIICPNSRSLLFCKLHPILLAPNFSLTTFALCHPCTLILHIYRSILASLLSSLSTSSAFRGHATLTWCITIRTHMSYNLPLTVREKPFVVDRDNRSLNFLYPLLLPAAILSERSPPQLIRSSIVMGIIMIMEHPFNG